MATEPVGLAAVILAGGISNRWGRDKSLVAWRGRRLVDHVASRLPKERVTTVLVVRREQGRTDWPADVVVHDDPDLPAGPLRGVIRGLESCGAERAWVVACDQPLISTALLRHLAAVTADGRVAVIPEWEGRLHPLLGVYRTAAVASLAGRLAAGERSLLGALNDLGFHLVDEAQCRRLDPTGESFLNLNRPEQLAALAARMPVSGGE
jgi:molybdopterin-guanine dinucleotide biosynthesis protein A